MSKRFGRNQKRRMREKIEALEKQVLTLEQSCLLKDRTINEQYNCLCRVEDIMGQGSFLGEPLQVTWRDLYPPDQFRVPKMHSRTPFDETPDPMLAVMIEENLPVMSAQIEKRGWGETHARIYYGKHQIGYAADPRVMTSMSRGRLIETIAKEAASLLDTQFRKDQEAA